MSETSERYDIRVMAAYVRGALKRGGTLFDRPPEEPTEAECVAVGQLHRAPLCL